MCAEASPVLGLFMAEICQAGSSITSRTSLQAGISVRAVTLAGSGRIPSWPIK